MTQNIGVLLMTPKFKTFNVVKQQHYCIHKTSIGVFLQNESTNNMEYLSISPIIGPLHHLRVDIWELLAKHQYFGSFMVKIGDFNPVVYKDVVDRYL